MLLFGGVEISFKMAVRKERHGEGLQVTTPWKELR